MTSRALLIGLFSCAVTLSNLIFSASTASAQIVFDFDTVAPTTTDELPDFFDVYGFDADFGDDPFWHVDENETNPDNDSNALHTVSDGNQLSNFFSRVAILKESVFFGEDVEISAEITWDDLGGDATDNAGLYVRFNGDSDEPLDNDYYFVRVGVDNGPPSSVTIYKVRDGFDEQLAQEIDDPFPVGTGDTVTLRVKAETVADGVEISVSLDDDAVFGMDPFLDDIDPLLGPGRVGVGQETNPTYFDNITISGTGAGVPGDVNGDGVCDAVDIDAIATAVKNGETDGRFDLNADGNVDNADRLFLIGDIKKTFLGDSNLDGEFNSSDFVFVFTAGGYEDGVAGNSGWSSGDWNGDMEFSSNDFVVAFQQGGYEQGPMQANSAVPEPTSLVLLVLGVLAIAWHAKSG